MIEGLKNKESDYLKFERDNKFALMRFLVDYKQKQKGWPGFDLLHIPNFFATELLA